MKFLMIAAVLSGLFQCSAEINVLQVIPGIPGAGSLAEIYVSGLVGISGLLTGSGVPLPSTLGSVRVRFGTVDAPILAVKNVEAPNGSSYQQINIQVPYEAPTATFTIIQGEQRTTFTAAAARWGIISQIIQHASDYRPVTLNDPPRAGEWIIVYGNNFGDVQNRLESGYPAGSATLSPVSTLIAGLDLWHFRLRLDNVITDVPLEIGYFGLAPRRSGGVPG